MRVVLDTNVFISGIFFSGPPSIILRAWRDGRLQLVTSAAIIDEYRRVGERLEHGFTGVSIGPFIMLLTLLAEVVQAPELPERVCTDASDDKFLACALAGACPVIVSGDKHLLHANGYRGIAVSRPRQFVDKYLAQ